MPLWLTIVIATVPLAFQICAGVWFISTIAGKLESVTDAERKTQGALEIALREISTLARQIAVNDEQHRTILTRLEMAEREVVSLREWRHNLANRQILYDQYEFQIDTLRREVDRIANRGR